MFNSELPLLIILARKNVVGAVFENAERRQVDEIGDLNPHGPVLTTQKDEQVSGVIRRKNIPSGKSLVLLSHHGKQRRNKITN